MRQRVLVLFPNPWDAVQFRKPEYQQRYEFSFLGDDFFKFPGTLKLITFDAVGFVNDVVREYRGKVDGVLSTDEYVGAILAAAIARQLGLPGGDPGRIIEAQHKYYSRAAQKRLGVEGTPDFSLVPISGMRQEDRSLPFPMFVKPVKGTFSLFAKLCDHFAALQRHLDFNVLERLAMRRVTRPFNDLLRQYTDFEYDAN